MTEALDIEADERTIRQGVQVLRLGVTEYARMDPADAAEHEVLTALDRFIQALRIARLNLADLKAGHAQCEQNMDAEIARLNEALDNAARLVAVETDKALAAEDALRDARLRASQWWGA